MSVLTSGMLWLVKQDEPVEKRLTNAVAYAEVKHGRPVLRIDFPQAESYPHQWGTIPMRPSRLIMANHIYLVTEESERIGREE